MKTTHIFLTIQHEDNHDIKATADAIQAMVYTVRPDRTKRYAPGIINVHEWVNTKTDDQGHQPILKPKTHR